MRKLKHRIRNWPKVTQDSGKIKTQALSVWLKSSFLTTMIYCLSINELPDYVNMQLEHFSK